MFVVVKDIVSKCTEGEEGEKLYKACAKDLKSGKNVRISFTGIGTVTDDFIFGFLSNVKNKVSCESFKQLHYVQVESRVVKKIKEVYSTLDR